MTNYTQLREYLHAVFEALCETHAEMLSANLVEELNALRVIYEEVDEADTSDISKDFASDAMELFSVASREMGDHSLWNKLGAGYEAMKLLRAWTRKP